MAGAWFDAAWRGAHVSYTTGVLHLRDAWHFSVGPCHGRETLSTAYHSKWHRISAGRSGFLGDRLHNGNAVVVGHRRQSRLRAFGRGTAVVQFEVMRIVIFGTGGVGGYFGGRLAQAGEDVTFVARGEHLRAIKTNGLRVDSSSGNFVVYPAKATDDVSEVGETELVILGVKAWQVPEAARAVKPIVDPNTTV